MGVPRCCAGVARVLPPPGRPRRTRPRTGTPMADRPPSPMPLPVPLGHALYPRRTGNSSSRGTRRLAARACAGAARCAAHISRGTKEKTTFTRYSCPHPACKLPRTKRGLRVSACSQVTAVQPYRSITFAGAAHSSTTSEERPPSPTGVTLCLFSEWKSSASPTCGQGQGQVGGLRGACWARQGSLGS